MGSGASKKFKNRVEDKEIVEIPKQEEEKKVDSEKIDKMFPWEDITIGADPIVPDNHVHHLRRSYEINEKTYQSWVKAISDSEQEEKVPISIKKKKPKKKVVKKKKKSKISKNSIEPSRSFEVGKHTKNYNKSFDNTHKPPFTFTRIPTPPSKFLNSRNYEHL